jgi:hypothetical protein
MSCSCRENNENKMACQDDTTSRTEDTVPQKREREREREREKERERGYKYNGMISRTNQECV